MPKKYIIVGEQEIIPAVTFENKRGGIFTPESYMSNSELAMRKYVYDKKRDDILTLEELKEIACDSSHTDLSTLQEDNCTNKRSYNSRQQALASLMCFKNNGKKNRGRYVGVWQRQIPYKCDICGKYHLTKMK